MRKKNYKGRCIKRQLKKCVGVCKTYDAVQYAEADLLSERDILDNTSTGRLIRTILLAFAEFERDLIVERTTEGRSLARERARVQGIEFHDGRPKKFSKEKIEAGLKMLQEGYSYRVVTEVTGISKSRMKLQQSM